MRLSEDDLNSDVLSELIEWLNGERYLINHKSTTMSEEFENVHQWELSRNRMIDKTIQKILELSEERKENKNEKL